MLRAVRFLLSACFVFLVAQAVFAAECASNYTVASHNVDYDFNIETLTPDVVDTVSMLLSTNTFILSDDGNCYAGYEPYVRPGNDIYPLIETSDLCPDGYYRSNGECVAFTSGGCPSDRYNSAVTNTTFVASEDGSCYTGYDVYSRTGNDIYPLVESSTVLCPSGHYMANGVCTPHNSGTCPDGMLNTTVHSTTWSAMTDGSCPSGYTSETINIIEFACDTYDSHVTPETTACLMMCTDGQVYTQLNSCASLCSAPHRLRTSTDLEFPLYATKQITPSINIQNGGQVCYVNLVPGQKTDSINVKYNDMIYHTVK